MILAAAWYVAVTLSNGDVQIVKQPMPSLSECRKLEDQITKDYCSTKCFYGIVPTSLPAQF